jgi:hypothetical protein
MTIDTTTLEHAGLPASIIHNAMRLARTVHPDTGATTLTVDHLADLFRCAPSTARSHLSKLQVNGWITYAKRGDWYWITVTQLTQPTSTTHPTTPSLFTGREGEGYSSAQERALSDQPCALSAQERAQTPDQNLNETDPGAQPRALGAQERALSAQPRAQNAHIRNWMDGWISTTTISAKNPSIQNHDERKRSRTLLTAPEIGVSLRIADALSKNQPAEQLFRQCCGYLWDQHIGIVNGPGALLYRLAHPEEFPPPPILPSWRGLPFFTRYATDEERSAADPETRNYEPDEYAAIINS